MSIPLIHSVALGEGKPVVLLHAFPLSHLLWEELKPPLGFQLILPDFPGFGLSPLAAGPLTLAEAAQGLQKHLAEKGIEGLITLGGISMGGYWAMEFIRQFPGQVQKIMFISTRPGVDKPEGRENRLKMADRVLRKGLGFLPAAMTPGLLGQTTRNRKPQVVDHLKNLILTTKSEAVALAQRAMADRQDQTGLMGKLSKAWLVAGREDTLIAPTEAQAMAQTIIGSQLRLLE